MSQPWLGKASPYQTDQASLQLFQLLQLLSCPDALLIQDQLPLLEDEIIENTGFQFALVDGKPSKCSGVRCLDCGFSTGYGCSEKIKEWLKSPCEKQKYKYKLSRFEYDLLNAYKVSGIKNSIRNYSTLFELHEKGYFKDVDENATIVDILEKCEVI